MRGRHQRVDASTEALSIERSPRSDAVSAVNAAVTAERRRLARDLHDSVAQELAFILSQSERLAQDSAGERALTDIASAAAHALQGLRSTIYGVLYASSCSFGEAVRSRAHELASRAGLGLTLDIDHEIASSDELQHAVLSIMQEAISNAARHAGATTLEISVRELGETLLVRISDDGQGFDPAQATPSTTGGLGLWSMQDRARALGGVLRLTSIPGRGTTVELEV
jgi:signal transduction histidine kinase